MLLLVLSLLRRDASNLESRAGFPPKPEVAEIQWQRDTDSRGDPALRIDVVLDEEFGREGPQWVELKPIQDAIRQALLDPGITDFAYLRFVTSQEFAAERTAR